MTPRTLTILAFSALVGCSDAPEKGVPVADGGTDPATDAGTADEGRDPSDCEGFLRWHEGECHLPEHIVSVRLTATAGFDDFGERLFEEALVCSSRLADEELAGTWRDANEVVLETDECIVTSELDPPNPFPYEPLSAEFGDVTVVGPDGVQELTALHDFEGCRTAPEDDTEFYAFGASYDVTIGGGTDAVPYAGSVAIPEDPAPDCPEFVAGEAYSLGWTASGADAMYIRLRRGTMRIVCGTDDDGEFTIPAEATALLSEDAGVSVSVRPRNTDEAFDPDSRTATTLLGEAWFECEFVDPS